MSAKWIIIFTNEGLFRKVCESKCGKGKKRQTREKGSAQTCSCPEYPTVPRTGTTRSSPPHHIPIPNGRHLLSLTIRKQAGKMTKKGEIPNLITYFSPSISLFFFLSLSLSPPPSLSNSLSLFKKHISLYLSIYAALYLPIYLSPHLSIYLSLHVPVEAGGWVMRIFMLTSAAA
jgi:hypothetical protein